MTALLLCACSSGGSNSTSANSSSETSPTAATDAGGAAPTPPGDILTGPVQGTISPVLAGLTRTAEGAAPGYETLTVEWGFEAVRAPAEIRFPPSATITIAEGREYEAKLETRDQAKVANTFAASWFNDGYGTNLAHAPLPPGLPLCGMLRELSAQDENANIAHLHATAQIPQGTTPSQLWLNGYHPVDLTAPPQDRSTACHVDTGKFTNGISKGGAAVTTEAGQSGRLTMTGSSAPVDIPVWSVGSTVYTANAISVPFTIENKSALDPLNAAMRLYSVDANGVLGFAVSCPEPSSATALPSLGPSQVASLHVCFPADNNPVGVLAVIQDPQQPATIGTFSFSG